jgi:hypothetical protein
MEVRMRRIGRLGTAWGSIVVGVAALAQPAAAREAPGAAEVSAAVERYAQDAALVGGAGSAGYDAGFWIRGGDFLLRLNLTLQARYEAFLYGDEQPFVNATSPLSGGHLSGFSLPRATLKLSGEAPCCIAYYAELEFGHFGREVLDSVLLVGGETHGNGPAINGPPPFVNLGPLHQSGNYDTLREAWIEWCPGTALRVRFGQVRIPASRQLMTPPELQQFVDLSLASICTGMILPGYTDRNRDHGILLHGALGPRDRVSWMVSVTNGDGGDSIRNVLDTRTSDNLAYGARVNWAFLEPIGYEEGPLRWQTCTWYGEVGAWGSYYADRVDRPHVQVTDAIRVGVDFAFGYAGSFGALFLTGAGVCGWDGDTDDFVSEEDWWLWFIQAGWMIPGTAFEVVARYGECHFESRFMGQTFETATREVAFGLNYYLNGHGNKLQVDVSIYTTDSNGGVFLFPGDVYAGIPLFLGGGPFGDGGTLLRFQWQLAL